MRMFYLEGGSGVKEHVPLKMIESVRRTMDLPLVVGGGISTEEAAFGVVAAGADIVVTGTLIEKEDDLRGSVSRIKDAMLSGWSERS
jgi:phosphoglycerol geranylgeranyltransferase